MTVSNQTLVPLVPFEKEKAIDDDDQAVLVLRNLIFDICNQNNGGHGGSAVGMAAIGVALWKHTMRYNPSDPEWFNRDRFVLSNGKSLKPVS
jgi:dihydroxyacetone synthase